MPSWNWPARERMSGWTEALEAAGIDPVVTAAQWRPRDAVESTARALLDRPNRPTAVLCFSDAFAVATMRVAQSLGLGVPEDLSVVGFDDSPEAVSSNPRLTTVHQEVASKGQKAVHALMGVMRDSASWRDAAKAVHIPYDSDLGVHPQSESFTRYAEWDFEATKDDYPLLLHVPYFQLYRKQVVKQADLVLAMHWCPEEFTAEQKARNVDYYEKITVRDSSLSACTQAVMCAEVGQLELAHDYAHEAALVDLRDLHHNTKDGLHLASLAGSWSTLVEGFGGLREHGSVLGFDPQLPDGIGRLAFRLRRHGMRLLVEITHDRLTCTLREEQGTLLLGHQHQGCLSILAHPALSSSSRVTGQAGGTGSGARPSTVCGRPRSARRYRAATSIRCRMDGANTSVALSRNTCASARQCGTSGTSGHASHLRSWISACTKLDRTAASWLLPTLSISSMMLAQSGASLVRSPAACWRNSRA